MDVQKLLRHGKPDEIRARTRELVRVLGKDGGYVMASAHEISSDVPLANIVAWVEELKTIARNP